ncbi:MAG: hypothetical protein IPP44_23075 [Ideonella sp.]|nr:hypothetical protein [Ideonella sp.]
MLGDLATDDTDISVALFSALSRGLADAALTLRGWVPAGAGRLSRFASKWVLGHFA